VTDAVNPGDKLAGPHPPPANEPGAADTDLDGPHPAPANEPVAADTDLDAIERDLDRVERALDELADGTYWQHARHDPVTIDPTATSDAPG
jgi:hypothetical protein